MRSRNKPTLPAPLESGRQRFERWRRSRNRSRRIPETLWSRAVKLAGVYGVCKTAQALGLDYTSLKNRVGATKPGRSLISATDPTFLELVPSSLQVPESVVEVEQPDGTKLRVHLKGGQAPDVVALVQRFGEQGR